MVGFVILIVGYTYLTLELSTLLITLYALKTGAELLYQTTSEHNQILSFAPSLEQFNRLRDEAQRLEQPSGSNRRITFRKGVSFKNISFAYPKQDPALQGVSIEIPKGKMTAIVGRSGSGKTTLIDILMGFYEPQTGQTWVDDTPLGKFDIHAWRQRIGFVPQDPFLFNATLRENLLWANEEASSREIANACAQAHVTEFVDRFPKGLDTLVGDRGVRLSGGQRQRIALARALLRKPLILVLDEATSSLDSHSERMIQEAVEQVSKSITVVVIAHRLSTIRGAECIYVLEGGRMVESGSFDELIQKSGEFSRTAQLQGLGPHA